MSKIEAIPLGGDGDDGGAAPADGGGDETHGFASAAIGAVNWKMKAVMFLLFILVSTNMFSEHVVRKFGDGTVREHGGLSNSGVAVTGIIYVLMYSLLATLDSNHMI